MVFIGGACMVFIGGACMVFMGVCMVFIGGGCVWFLWGHAWFYWGACVVFIGGACMVFIGGMHGFYWGGMCGFYRGHACFFAGGCVFFSGGVHGFFRGVCIGYDEIRSMSGRYASYWNAFLFAKVFAENSMKMEKNSEGMRVPSAPWIRQWKQLLRLLPRALNFVTCEHTLNYDNRLSFGLEDNSRQEQTKILIAGRTCDVFDKILFWKLGTISLSKCCPGHP